MTNKPSESRWRLRLENYSSALTNLRDAAEQFNKRQLSVLEQAGMVQLFGIVWECGWKTMRDYLSEIDLRDDLHSPAVTIRTAFATGLIPDAQSWMDAGKLRNTLAHEYHPDHAQKALGTIATQYLGMFQNLARRLADEGQ